MDPGIVVAIVSGSAAVIAAALVKWGKPEREGGDGDDRFATRLLDDLDKLRAQVETQAKEIRELREGRTEDRERIDHLEKLDRDKDAHIMLLTIWGTNATDPVPRKPPEWKRPEGM